MLRLLAAFSLTVILQSNSALFSPLTRNGFNPTTPTLLRKLPTPFLLESICRGWRQLARSTPGLWSTLSFTLAKLTKRECLPELRNWSQFSSSLLLTIRVLTSVEASLSHRRDLNPSLTSSIGIPGVGCSTCIHFCGTSPPSSLCDLRVIIAPYDSDRGSPDFRMGSPGLRGYFGRVFAETPHT